MLRIRLTRNGKRHQPHYRVVVAENTAPVQGKFVASLGHYDPRTKELIVAKDEVLTWLNKGAQPSNTIARLLAKQGMSHKLLVVQIRPERPSKKAQAEAGDATPETPVEAVKPEQEDAPTEETTSDTPAEEPTAE